VAANVQREITLAQATTWMLTVLGSIAALSWACMLFLFDQEQHAALVGFGGLALIAWAAYHLTDRLHGQ
jgi:hypothetical protein